jgi:hypothetical protein
MVVFRKPTKHYEAALSLILRNHCCLGRECVQDFENKGYPFAYFACVSTKCNCTVCKHCLDRVVEKQPQNWTGWTVSCPSCFEERAFNLRRLVPNMALVAIVSDVRRLLNNPPPQRMRVRRLDL